MSSRHLETERTYELPDGGEVPDLVSGPGGAVASVEDVGTVELHATYFDTADLALLAHRVTLRRRVGGHDAGWHLKLPGSGDTRHEVRWPVGSDAEVPSAVESTVTSMALGRPLQPVVALATTRHRRLLRTADQIPLVEVCDDRVAATLLLDRPAGSRAPAGQSAARWREVEVELVDGDEHVLELVHDAVLAAGGTPSKHPSKLARALADHVMPPPPRPADASEDAAGAALVSYLRTHLAALRSADVSWRLNQDGEGVHDIRVAARRLRTALTVYRPLLDESVARRLQSELRLLGQKLSPQRDRQVERERLHRLLDDENEDAAARILALAAHDRSTYTNARARTRRAMRAGRYVDLLTDLHAVASGVGMSPLAVEPAAAVLPNLVDNAHRRLRRRRRRAAKASLPDRSRALHDVRKAAKRLRYACEVAQAALGKRTRKRRKRASRVQTALGDHLDALALAGWLRALAGSGRGTLADGFVLGRLHADQLHLAHVAEQDAARLVRRLA